MTTSIDLRLAKIKAQQEALEHRNVSLTNDRNLVKDIMTALAYESENDIWADLPAIDPLLPAKDLHHAYLNLLARVLLRSEGSVAFNEDVRKRFAEKKIICAPSKVNLTEASHELLRSKFINLLEIHGEVRHPTRMERFKVWFQGVLDRIGGKDVQPTEA